MPYKLTYLSVEKGRVVITGYEVCFAQVHVGRLSLVSFWLFCVDNGLESQNELEFV